ncbi:MAG: domain S-box [Geobacteraceae bacterium]|nr:domain S-box [Geobacteraceae bacterium]
MPTDNVSRNELLRKIDQLHGRIAELEKSGEEYRKETEKLRQGEERFRSFFMEAPLSYQSLDRNGCFIEVNQAWLNILGYAREEVIGAWFGDFLAPGYQDRFVRNFPCFKEAGEIRGIEFEMLRKDGSAIRVSFHGRISSDDGGNFEKTHCIFEDVTHRKLVEDCLRQSEERMRLAVEATELGTWDYDLVTGSLTWSERCKRIFGVPPETMVNFQLFLLCLHPDDAERAHLLLLKAFDPSGSGEYETEYRTVWPDGSIHWISAKGRTLFEYHDGERKAVRILGTALDITERKQAEEALWNNNRRLNLLAETANHLLRSDSPQTVVDSLCHRVLTFLDCDSFFNYLVDEERNRLRLNACGGIPDRDRQKMQWLDYGVGLCGCSARDGCRLVVDDVQSIHDQYTDLVRPFGIRAYACHPLVARGKVIGTLSFCSRKRTGFTDDELSLMQVVADQVAIAMERSRSEAELRRAHCELDRQVEERTEQLTRVIENLQEEIYERQRTEEALRKSEERYALAVEGANDGIWDRDFTNGRTYYSPRWKSILGYQDHEIENSREEWASRIHGDDYEAVRGHLNDYLAGQTPVYKIEYRMLHKDGSYRWILARGACIRDSKGKPYRMAGSHTDITVRKQAAEALRKNEELLRTILETLPVGVVAFDAEGRILLENRARRAIWEIDEEKSYMLGDYKGWFSDSGEPVDRDDWPVYRASMKGVTESRVIDIECFNGVRKTVIVSAAPLIINGAIVAGIGVVEDITGHRMLEQQLLQAQKMESIGLLAGGLAHEFNNLLTAISGCAEEIQEIADRTDATVQSNVSMILTASREAAELTRNLLAFSRQQIFTMVPVAINDLIVDAGKFLVKTLGAKINFSADLSPEELTVMADSGQLKHVLVNFALNAKDAMSSGGRLLISTRKVCLDEEAVRQRNLEKAGTYAAISVSDTGAGMDEKTVEKIFEPFFTTKEVGKGTGLGLSIVYGIIRQHNGTVDVESRLGKGTCFTIYLPLVNAGIIQDSPREKVIGNSGTVTVLVVEDEEFVRIFLEKTLTRAGYHVITAEDGDRALEKFRGSGDSIGLVISDMVMPKKGGRELFEEIRSMNPAIKVLFITGYSSDIIERKYAQEENVQCMTKPFRKKDLLDRVEYMLSLDPDPA